MRAALALPILAVPVHSAAAEVGEVGFSFLNYKERDRMKVSEPVMWVAVPFARAWELRASVLVDIVTGASPGLVSNASGRPVQTLTGASVNDRRKATDVKVSRHWEDFTLAASRATSDENDYRSRAFGLEARVDLRSRTSTLVAGFGKSNDRVGSSDNLRLDERRATREYLLGVTQVLTPRAVVQSNLQWSRGTGWYDDPYRLTVTFYPDGVLPALFADHRPASRDSLAWLTRYRLHLPEWAGTLQADYRFFRDNWGIRGHAVEVAWSRDVAERWFVRPALRGYTQSSADFYSPAVARPAHEFQSSDQRLAAFGGLSPSLRVGWRDGAGLTLEATAGYYHSASRYRLGGRGSPEYEDLRANYFLLSMSREF